MAHRNPPMWRIGSIPLLSQREIRAPSWEPGVPINGSVRFVPAHVSYSFDRTGMLTLEAACLAMVVFDISMQIATMRSVAEVTELYADIADDQDVDFSWIRGLFLTLPLIRTVAYGLYSLDFVVYRLVIPSQSFEDWTGPGSSLCRKIRALLPGTSTYYTYLRVTTMTAICSLFLYSVVKPQILRESLDIRNPGGLAMLLDYWPIVPILFSLFSLTQNLLLSSKHLAKWIYVYEEEVDRVTLRFQLDRWRRWEQSSSLGLEVGATSNFVDQGSHRVPVYAPLRTIMPGESLSKLLPAARREARRHTALFVRCDCCFNDHCAISLADLHPIRVPHRIHFWSKREYREQQAYSDFLARRAALLDSLPARPVDRSWMMNRTAQPSNHRLCASCTVLAFRLQYDFNESWFSSWIRGWTSVRTFRLYRHLPNPICLATSAKTCHLCAIFWQELTARQKRQLLRYDRAFESTAGLVLPLQASRCIYIAFDKDNDSLIAHFGGFRRPRRWIYPARGHDSSVTGKQLRGRECKSPITVSAGNIGNLRMPDISGTGSSLSVEVIRRWLRLSKAPINPDWVPSRLVDVSAVSTGTICIKNRQDIPLHDRRYLALSHCWGPADFRTYNRPTKEMFESTIPLDEMAKTFKDLFWLAGQLGIPYVWIDALCILQNDSDDWHSEASTMFQVYLSATLTVVAAASWSSTEGLFRATRTRRKGHCLLYGQRDKAKTDEGCTFAWSKSDLEDATRPDNNIRWSRWESRAWTLQEQALSSRIVYFTDTDLAFEEKDVLGGETSELRMDTTENSVTLERWMRAREGHTDDPTTSYKPTSTQASFSHTWWDWVSSYTHRSLTDPKDRAIAILGLAQYLGRPRPDGLKPRYLAGLWEPNLAESLLWYVQLGAATRPLIARAPTWSWLSVQGGIVNDSIGLNAASTGVEIDFIKQVQPRRPAFLEQTQLYNISPTLAKGSFIQLRGKVKPLTLINPPHQPAYYYNSCADVSVSRYPELHSNAVLGALATASASRIGPRCYQLLHLAGPDSTIACVGWYIPDSTDEVATPDILHCLCFTAEPRDAQSREDFTKPWATRGLALRLLDEREVFDDDDDDDDDDDAGRAVPAYKRIGYFELEWRSTGVYLPFDAHHFRDLKYHPRRVAPEIDPHGVFGDCGACTFRLY